MAKALVAIVGRTNVGKSTFFNKIVGRRISIVKNEPGVTRDRVYADAEWIGEKFTLMDTGGIDLNYKDEFDKNIIDQAEIAVDLADVVVFMLDARDGLTDKDKEVALFLRKRHKKIIPVVNKSDLLKETDLYDFYKLGLGDPVAISSEHGLGFGDLLDLIVSKFNGIDNNAEQDEHNVKVAIVGKPNAGKSSILNKILNEQRVIVSPVSGTTRDSIDTSFKYNEDKYLLIDTAGIRRKKKIEKDTIERYSIIRSLGAIRRSDVSLVVIDAEDGITEQDIKILGFVHEQGKPSLIVINKWDIVEQRGDKRKDILEAIKYKLKFMPYCEIMFISAKTGKGMKNLFEKINYVNDNSLKRIPTSSLNEIINDSIHVSPPKSNKGKLPKVYYTSQVEVKPPRFIVFVNDKDIFHFSYERYLENQIRAAVDYKGTPLKIIMKSKSKHD